MTAGRRRGRGSGRGRLTAGLAGVALGGLTALTLVAGCSAANAERSGDPAVAVTTGAPATTAGGADAARDFRSTL